MAGDINRVVLVGRLTRDPELRHLPSGTPVLQLGMAVNGRQKDDTGKWVDKPNFFDVKLFGNQAESSRSTSRRARGSASTAGWTGRHGKPRTARSARRSRSSRRQVQFLDSREPAPSASEPQYVTAGAAATSDPDRATSAPRRSRRRHSLLRRRDTVDKDRDRRAAASARAAPSAGPARRKSCYFCREKIEEVDYKNYNQLRRFASEKGKIRSRRITGACRRHQDQIAVAVKRAREMALLPYVGS